MTTALEEAPPNVNDSEPVLVPGAAQRWADHLKMIEEDRSLTPAEKVWYSDPTPVTAPEVAAMIGLSTDRIHALRGRPARPMPHPQTWLEHDFMGVVRRNVPGWFLGRLRYYLQLKGSHVFDPRLRRKYGLVPGMLTVDPETKRYVVVKTAPRHGRSRKFRPNLSRNNPDTA